MFGETLLSIPVTFEHTKFPSIEDKMKNLIKDREEALAAHELARTRMAERRKSTFIPFKVGDQVWLDSRNLKTNHHKKIGPKREGPFEIEEKLGPLTYQLKLPPTWKIHNVFHAVLLQQYNETETYGNNFSRPPPELLEGEEVYEVEDILKHRKQSILCQMEGLSYFRSNVGTRRIIFKRWRHTIELQNQTSPTLNETQKNEHPQSHLARNLSFI